MTNFSNKELDSSANNSWLKRSYFTRAAFSVVWVLLALTIGRKFPSIACIMLIAYPAWDGLANYWDASRSGGLSNNPSQSFNLAVSILVTIAVAAALTMNMNWVLGVFGVWAIFSGLLQLATAVRRWKTTSGQWSMILSGAQSSLAGGFFISQALMPSSPSIADVAGYAGFGAFYFLVSAVSLKAKELSKPTKLAAIQEADSHSRFARSSER